jgi:murein DD-endopeptidase MepM/ murein hydrolase activator NlpD
VALGLAVLATIALVALAGRHSGDARAASTGASVARAATASARALARAEPGRRTGSVQVSGSGRRTGAGTAASASTAGGKGNAVARAGARDVSLLDGYVTAHLVQVRAHASAGATALTGSVTRLVVNGKPKTVPPGGASFGFGGGAGRLIALERSGSGISGLHVTLDRAFAGKPAGYAATVGFATARASDAVAAAPKPKPSKPGATPGKPHKPARAKRRRAPRLKALATDRGYAFPVYGEHSFSDDWGAPRQDTGFHEGNDVFAKAGTPVVAVADGKLRKVGTAPVPGNRLWLDTKKGDQFFYGHLSAFAREARSGAQVKAGQVIGFVGSTGDAEQTPPHLHFEVHPGGGKAVDPYPFLRAWEGRRDVPAAAWLRRYAADAGSQPGTLVVVRDFIAR